MVALGASAIIELLAAFVYMIIDYCKYERIYICKLSGNVTLDGPQAILQMNVTYSDVNKCDSDRGFNDIVVTEVYSDPELAESKLSSRMERECPFAVKYCYREDILYFKRTPEDVVFTVLLIVAGISNLFVGIISLFALKLSNKMGNKDQEPKNENP